MSAPPARPDQYQNVVEDLTEVVCRFKPDGAITFVNDVYCRFFGKAADKLLGSRWHPVAVAEDVPLIEAKLREISPSNPVAVIENRVYDADGNVRWMQFVNRSLYDAENRLVEMQAVGRDITDRKEAEILHGVQHGLMVALAGAKDLAEGLRLCVNAGLAIAPFDSGAFYLVDDRTGALEIATSRGLSEGFLRRVAHYAPDSPNASLVMAGAPVYARYEEAGLALSPEERAEGLRSLAVIPMRYGSHILGCLNMASRAANNLPLRSRTALETIAAGATQAILRLKAEEATRRSEERFRIALAAANYLVVFNQDRDLRYTWVGNPALGLKPEEGLGRTDEEILGTEAAAPLVAIKRRVLETGRGERRELALSREGQAGWFDLMVEPLRDAAGNLVGITGAALDITERKKTEEALRESQTLLHQVGESAPDSVFVIDAGYRLLFSNRQHQCCLAASGDRPFRVGESVLSPSLPRETRELWQSAYDRALGGEKVELATTWTDAEGHNHVSENMLSPLRDAHGATVGALVAARDITERQRTEADLRRSHEALRALTARVTNAREEERQRISREIHDELGHAFTALKFDLAWLDRRLKERGMDARSGARRRLAAMMRRAEAELDTTRRIATALRPALLDTLGLAAAVEWEARQFEARTRIRCELELPRTPVPLDSGRATAVFRICQEALSNVALHAATATRVRVELRRGPAGLRLVVEDNGRGITDGEAGDSRSVGLLGMRERAIEFGGTVGVTGSPGRGTTVALDLPLPPP